MTTLRQIVTDAFRESGIVAVGETPGGDEFTEALRRLQTIIKSLFGHELGEQLKTVNFTDVSSQSTLPVNVRVVFDSEGSQRLLLDGNPRDGARFALIDNGGDFGTNNVIIEGNGRKIESANFVALTTNSVNREWFYRADTGNWAKTTDLKASEESPFPTEFDDFLTTLLALRINPRYGAETKQEMMETYSRMRRQFRARYRQEQEMAVEDGLIFLPSSMSRRFINWGF